MSSGAQFLFSLSFSSGLLYNIIEKKWFPLPLFDVVEGILFHWGGGGRHIALLGSSIASLFRHHRRLYSRKNIKKK